MELSFARKTLSCYQPLEPQRINQEETLELTVPESLPDPQRIVDEQAELILRAKELSTGSVSVSGAVQACVLYVAEEETEPRMITGYLPFNLRMEQEGVDSQSEAELSWQVKSVDVRMLSSRKLLVRVNLSALFRVWKRTEFSLSTLEEHEESVQLLERSYPMLLPACLTERPFQLQQDAELPTSLSAIGELLCYRVQVQVQEQKISAMNLAFRGVLRLSMRYRNQEGSLGSFETELPFTQYVDLPEHFEEAESQMSLLVTDRDLILLDERHVQLQLAMLAQVRVSSYQTVCALEDIYSTECQLLPQRESVSISALLDARELNRTVQEPLNLPCTQVEGVRAIAGVPEISRREGGFAIAVNVEVQLLCRDAEGKLHARQARVKAEFSLEAAEKCRILAKASVLDAFASPSNGGVEFRCTVRLRAECWCTQTLELVCGAECQNLPERKDRPSVVIRRVTGGESLWSIAKQAGSSVKVLRQVNGLASQEPPEGTLLLIPML